MSDDRQEPPAGDADATRPLPQDTGDATARQQSVNQTDRQPAVPPAWSGRAGVPPPRPAGYDETGTEWYAEEQAGRRWWMPILLGILAMALVALIGLGVWLALRAAQRDPGSPPAPSPAPTTAPEATTAPTTTAPSTSPPTTAPGTPPTTMAAAQVPMPPLVGLPEAAARAALDLLDVPYRVERRPSDQPAGTVIETDPAAGGLIAGGNEVTIVVAEAGAATTAASPGTPGSTAARTL
ncbi:PASTA domain-containing protein [Micromonospora sp. NPDC048999]|uniref:PASTA domain-containing protein n=1 Tax=Micromonospora sp. NPDC048999 TaxID=3155391 RepID=UPI0033E19B59